MFFFSAFSQHFSLHKRVLFTRLIILVWSRPFFLAKQSVTNFTEYPKMLYKKMDNILYLARFSCYLSSSFSNWVRESKNRCLLVHIYNTKILRPTICLRNRRVVSHSLLICKPLNLLEEYIDQQPATIKRWNYLYYKSS